MKLTKRVRLNKDLASQLKLRMEELGFHPEQHLHLGELTWLFTHREWVLVTQAGKTAMTIWPPDKTMNDVTSELRHW